MRSRGPARRGGGPRARPRDDPRGRARARSIQARRSFNAEDARLRRELARLLLRLPDEEASRALFEHAFWLEDAERPDVYARWDREGNVERIARAAELDHTGAAAFLVSRALRAEEPAVALTALWSAHPKARPGLGRALLGRKEPVALAFVVDRFTELDAHQRLALAQRFASTLDEALLPAMRAAVVDRDATVRRAALDGLAQFERRDAALARFDAVEDGTARDLIALLDAKDRLVVIGAVRSLGAIRCHRALPRLVRLLERDDAELREAVHEAICRVER